jgi:hypothetical protein
MVLFARNVKNFKFSASKKVSFEQIARQMNSSAVNVGGLNDLL